MTIENKDYKNKGNESVRKPSLIKKVKADLSQ